MLVCMNWVRVGFWVLGNYVHTDVELGVDVILYGVAIALFLGMVFSKVWYAVIDLWTV